MSCNRSNTRGSTVSPRTGSPRESGTWPTHILFDVSSIVVVLPREFCADSDPMIGLLFPPSILNSLFGSFCSTPLRRGLTPHCTYITGLWSVLRRGRYQSLMVLLISSSCFRVASQKSTIKTFNLHGKRNTLAFVYVRRFARKHFC